MSFWEKVKILMSKVGNFLAPILKTVAKRGGAILLQIALDAVMKVEASDLKGAAKRDEAFRIIKESIARQGLEFAKSEIHSAISIAIQKMEDPSE